MRAAGGEKLKTEPLTIHCCLCHKPKIYKVVPEVLHVTTYELDGQISTGWLCMSCSKNLDVAGPRKILAIHVFEILGAVTVNQLQKL